MPSLFGFRKSKKPTNAALRKSTSVGDLLSSKNTPTEPSRLSLSQSQQEIRQEDYPLSAMALLNADNERPSSFPDLELRYDHDLATKFSDFRVNDLELLLSMETQARMDALEERERQRQLQRPTRLRFDLPQVHPPPAHAKAKPKIKRRSGWTLFANHRRNSSHDSYNSDDQSPTHSSLDEELAPTTCSEIPVSAKPLQIGSKVRLIRRPLPTHGRVRYIGPVDCYPGHEWIGVELESRVGKNDGSVKGKRYFVTDAQRGVFLLRGDLAVV